MNTLWGSARPVPVKRGSRLGRPHDAAFFEASARHFNWGSIMKVWHFAFASACFSLSHAAVPSNFNYECNEWSDDSRSRTLSQYRVRWDGTTLDADHDGNGFSIHERIVKAGDVSGADPDLRSYSFVSTPSVDRLGRSVTQRYLVEIWTVNDENESTPLTKAYPQQVSVTQATYNADDFLIAHESYVGSYCASK